LQGYITDQVKKTAQKIKGDVKIYPIVFLVVPTIAAHELKKTSFYEEGFSFFIVTMEALEPILTSIKRIESYEFAEAMDPQERENVIDMIAQFDFHISSRNAVDFMLMKHGLETLSKMENLNPDMVKEAKIKRAKIRAINLNSAEQKKLAADTNHLQHGLLELTNPKPHLPKEDLELAEKSMDE
jgi:hypothetical protein